ncbi:MAG: hypothetical protein AAGC95_15455 [Pseudomonadota bacterium]
MRTTHYERDYWEDRLRRAVRAERGFPWAVFIIGFVLGALIF